MGQQTVISLSYFVVLLPKSSSQQYVWPFHPSPTTAVVCSLLHVLTRTDVHMPTPKLKPLPSFPSPQHNTNVGNESAAARKGKPEKFLANAKRGLTTGLDWGLYCKRAYKKTTNQNTL